MLSTWPDEAASGLHQLRGTPLTQHTSPEAVAHLAASLPQTFDPLVAEAQRRDLDIMPTDQFWARVRQRLDVDDTTARLATDAVLETLAERIAAGQVEDLIAAGRRGGS